MPEAAALESFPVEAATPSVVSLLQSIDRRLAQLADGPPELLDVDAAARLCGMAPRTWQGAASAGRVPPGEKIQGKRLWSRRQLLEWVAGGCKPWSTWSVRQAAKANAERFAVLRDRPPRQAAGMI
jgi:hypothetical protein